MFYKLTKAARVCLRALSGAVLLFGCSLLITLVIMGVFAAPAAAHVVMVRGEMRTSVATVDRRTVHIPQGVTRFRLLMPNYPSFSAGPNLQQIESFTTYYSVAPTSQRVITDKYGNHFSEVIWENPRAGDIRMQTRARVALALHARPSAGRNPFPLNSGELPYSVLPYLRPTALVQSNDFRIRRAAACILQHDSIRSESDAVNGVINYVVDHVRYGGYTAQTDAVHTLAVGQGECTNFAHLSIALLRALGIPARFVAGLSFQQPYTVAGNDETTYTMDSQELSGFLYHAWIQVYFPGEGWVEYDPQGDYGLVDTRRIVFAVAPDKDSLPEGRFINTRDVLTDPDAFSEESEASVTILSDNVSLAEVGAAMRGPMKEGIYMARALQ